MRTRSAAADPPCTGRQRRHARLGVRAETLPVGEQLLVEERNEQMVGR